VRQLKVRGGFSSFNAAITVAKGCVATAWFFRAIHLLAIIVAVAAGDLATGITSAQMPPAKLKSGSLGKDNTVPGFFTASDAFREHAIKVLGTKAVNSGPNS
jgi:hypothetical protein